MEKILQTLQHFINEFKKFKKQDEHIILAKLFAFSKDLDFMQFYINDMKATIELDLSSQRAVAPPHFNVSNNVSSSVSVPSEVAVSHGDALFEAV